jgi:hypothetical protein
MAGNLPDIRQPRFGRLLAAFLAHRAKPLQHLYFQTIRARQCFGISAALSTGMTNATTYELTERTPGTRTPACTLEEARQLIDDLKAEYQMLSESERREVRQALKEVAQSRPATMSNGDWK